MPGIHYAIFALISPPILQSEQVDTSWGKSGQVCRLQLTDSTENLVVYDGHRHDFLASDFDSIQSEDMIFDIFSRF